MTRTLSTLLVLLTLVAAPALADDAGDVRATIESHYSAIHSGEIEDVLGHHREDFTMFWSDGGILWESDWSETSQRMGATVEFGTANVRMSDFNAQIYGDVAVATFYLVGTETRGSEVRSTTNRVTAIWVKTTGEWREAHHHESPLRPHGYH